MKFLRRSAHVCIAFLTLLLAITLPVSSFALSLPTNHQLWDTGSDIHDLQVWLNSNGYPLAASGPGSAGQETGLFGPLTYRALLAYQATHNLPATGYLGPQSREVLALATSSAWSFASTTPPTQSFQPLTAALSASTTGIAT